MQIFQQFWKTRIVILRATKGCDVQIVGRTETKERRTEGGSHQYTKNMAKSSKVISRNVHIHGTASAELFNRVLFISLVIGKCL